MLLFWILVIILVLAAGIFLWPEKVFRPFVQPFLKKLQKSPREVPVQTIFRSETASELAPPVTISATWEPAVGATGPELPHSYGVDRMVLLARDPYWLYAYWEITATRQEKFKETYGAPAWTASRPVLRVYDVTGVPFNGLNANGFQDIEISEQTDNWHIPVGEPDRAFCVDLGRMFPDGRFITLLRSNIASTPRASLSDRTDEEWMWIEGIYRSISRLPLGVSSPLIVEEIAERAGVLPLGISSPGFEKPRNN
ncbi:MAG: DUF4912 domain-containing protein [Peptococcaceae bacterium]|nr:MAG: DUF4912 domain-containing protein [Peptococcaceae bacterium]